MRDELDALVAKSIFTLISTQRARLEVASDWTTWVKSARTPRLRRSDDWNEL